VIFTGLKMKKTTKQGFVLVMVIVAIALTGMVMFVLSDGSRTMIFQTDTAYLNACRRNLVSSGLAWAKTNAGSTAEGEMVLDVNDLGVGDASLRVSLVSEPNEAPSIRIATSVSRRTRTLRDEATYAVIRP
jgi:hypothetical protein